MINKRLKLLGSLLAIVSILGIGSQAFAYSSANGLNSTEQTQWNNLYTSFNNEYNNRGYVQYYSFNSQELEDNPYQSLFDTNGQLKNGYNGIQLGWKHNNNILTTLNAQVNIQHYYLLLYNNSNTIITASKCYIGAYNYLSMSCPLGQDLEFDADFTEYNNYISIGANSLVLYEITFNNTLQYFCNRYGFSWRNGDNDFTIDGGLSLYLEFNGYITSLSAYLYDDETMRTYLGYNNEYVNAQSSGYSRGYSEGQTNGYNTGYSEGQTNGYNTGYSVGLTQGYNEGQASVSDGNATIMGLFGAIANVPITILNGVVGPSLLGVPIISILLTFLSILLILWLIKKFIK